MSFTPSVIDFKVFRDKEGGDNTLIRNVPLYINKRTLSASTAASDTVPAGATMVIISANGDVWVNCNGTASTTAETDGSGSELNPSGYAFELNDAPTAISMYCVAGCDVSLAYYKM